jgi:hypothetical protein
MNGTDPPTFMEQHGSRWLHRAADQPAGHQCRTPTRPEGGVLPEPDGQEGDIWQCGECDQRWLIAEACDACFHGGHRVPDSGQHTVGLTWRPISERQARKLLRRAAKARR